MEKGISSVLFNFCMAFAIAMLVPSCTSDRLQVDISGVEVSYQSKRLDQALFHAETKDYKALNSQLHNDFGEFYSIYVSEIINVGKPDFPMIATNLERFASEANWRETQDQIDKVFPDMAEYDEDFKRAFRYYRYHFPQGVVPEVVYYNSGFNVGVFPDEEFLGVGLEWFLGTENPVIQRLSPEEFPMYFKNKLRPEYLVNNAVKGWLMVKHQELVTKEELMTLMIFHGKMMYLMDALFPDVTDEVKINYSTEELAWCSKNEFNIWTYLVEEEMLYATKPKELAGFFSDGPFTPAFQHGSPARTGVWLGWQIIRQYMDKNPEVTLEQMLRENNPQKILKFYKP